jgi:hypothetical protein
MKESMIFFSALLSQRIIGDADRHALTTKIVKLDGEKQTLSASRNFATDRKAK